MCEWDGDGVEADVAEVLRRLVRLARARPDDLISVAGPQGGQALSLLCRDGFERVQCAREATCGGVQDASDALILAGGCPMESLTRQARRTVGLLRDGGMLVVQLNQLDDDLDLQRSLEGCGYEITATVFDLSHEVLAAHRVARRATLTQAA